MQTKTIFAGAASTICCCRGKHSVLRQVSRSFCCEEETHFRLSLQIKISLGWFRFAVWPYCLL